MDQVLKPIRFTDIVKEINSRMPLPRRCSQPKHVIPVDFALTRKDFMRTTYNKNKRYYQGKYLDYIYLDEFVRDRVLHPQKTYQKGNKRCNMKDTKKSSFDPAPPLSDSYKSHISKMVYQREKLQSQRIKCLQNGKVKNQPFRPSSRTMALFDYTLPAYTSRN